MTSIFGIVPSDSQNKLVPNGSNTEFQAGTTGNISDAVHLSIVEMCEDKLKANLDTKYRILLSRIDGEVLVNFASAGDTSFTTSFQPISNLKLYKNIPTSAWEIRTNTYLISPSDYTANTTTGAIVLSTPLSEGDRIVAEYSHTGAGRLAHLKDLVVTMVALEVAKRYPYFNSGDLLERFTKWNEDVENDLRRLRKREIGIAVFDDLNLVYDDTDGNNRGYYNSYFQGRR